MAKETATLKKIDENTLAVTLDGEVRQIGHQLSELKALLQEKGTQTVQYAEKIYNIEHIDSANFGLVTGRRAFNEQLTRKLMEHIRPHSDFADRFLKQMESKGIADWETQKNYRNPAKKIIADSYVGIIGWELSKLMAIGDENHQGEQYDKEYFYLEKCLRIVTDSLSLVNFTLLSSLWDLRKTDDIALSSATETAIEHRLESNFVPTLMERLALLRILHTAFYEVPIICPFTELKDFGPLLASDGPVTTLIKSLEELNEKLDQQKHNLVDCSTAEELLADFLGHFAFLTHYNMASIKRVGYRQPRHEEPGYFHRYIALGIDLKNQVDAEKGKYAQTAAPTDAVLIYRGDDYAEAVNLFPFVIDYNALTYEHGAKIAFFQSIQLVDNSLDYRILLDGSTQNIVANHTFNAERDDMGEFLLDDERCKAHNLDCVVNEFSRAKSELIPVFDLDNL